MFLKWFVVRNGLQAFVVVVNLLVGLNSMFTLHHLGLLRFFFGAMQWGLAGFIFGLNYHLYRWRQAVPGRPQDLA